MQKIENHSPNINVSKTSNLIKKCLSSNWISTSGKFVSLFEKIFQVTQTQNTL